MASKVCGGCGEDFGRDEFSDEGWERDPALCIECEIQEEERALEAELSLGGSMGGVDLDGGYLDDFEPLSGEGSMEESIPEESFEIGSYSESAKDEGDLGDLAEPAMGHEEAEAKPEAEAEVEAGQEQSESATQDSFNPDEMS